jgi:cell division protein ZipA
MDGLRWLLLIFGAIVVAGVYLYTRRQNEKPPAESLAATRVAPTLGEDDADQSEPAPEANPVRTEQDSKAHEDPAPDVVRKADPAAPQKIVTLRVVAKNKGAFKGDELILSLRGIGMRSGKFGIYHRYDGNDESRTVFSAASLVEPGSFDLKNIKEQEIPGISIFMIIPGPLEAAEAFDLMLQSARALTQGLGAELLDESGSSLSIQRERYMREEVIQFQHRTQVA